MDPTIQLLAHEATGWRAGTYDDIERTLRAPLVNSVWRVAMAHEPALFRHVWHQLKPVFETRRFGAFSVAYRDTVCSGLDADELDPAALEAAPAEVTELRGQLATFDIVAPRLAVAFETCDRLLNGGDVASTPGEDRAATAPMPAWLDADRGRPVTLAGMDEAAERAPEAVAAVSDYHDLGAMLPSIHRCLAQWPAVFDALWTRLEPSFTSTAYGAATDEAAALVDAFVRGLPTAPALRPEQLQAAGFEAEAVDALADHFAGFTENAGDVLPTLVAYADTVGAAGERDALSFP
ncbi:halocarboxylic acid dehydrogenase DehI family protein [Halosegnis sp.]|uniref:halocarboxylic acid dehydrogenase DehI family protein n=1 Tax=Halosegnis sp. TaxID=2864959 RepID=UPI0035D49AE5